VKFAKKPILVEKVK